MKEELTNHNSISFIMTCKGRLEHVRQSLPRIANYEDSEIIFVDSNCPDFSGKWVEDTFKNVKVHYLNDDGEFNLSRARNFGARFAKNNYLCFIDADILIKQNFLDVAISHLKNGYYFTIEINDKINGMYGISGTCIINRNDFDIIGGYDECFRGWGGEDKDIYTRLNIKGINHFNLPIDIISNVINHSNEDRIKFYSQKSLELSQTIASVYRFFKIELIKETGKNLSLNDRNKLYQKCYRSVTESIKKSINLVKVEMELPAVPHVQFMYATYRRKICIELDLSQFV